MKADRPRRETRHVLQLQKQSVRPDDRVLLVDDWIERGSQAATARDLIERGGAELAGIAVIVDQTVPAARAGLPTITSIVAATELPG